MADETRKDLPTATSSTHVSDASGSGGSADAGSTRDTARGIWNDAKADVRAVVDERQQATASGIADFADALRGAAGSVDSATTAHIAEGAADALDRISRTLRSKEAGAIVQDLEALARKQPALFLGAAVAAGFLAIRFLKSGGEPRALPGPAPAAEPQRAPWAFH